MLYQTILEETAARNLLGGREGQVPAAIRKAGRFLFDETSSRALAQLALTKPSRMLLAREFLRLPFDTVWFEYLDAERKALWRERGGKVNRDHRQPLSSGVLLWRDPAETSVIHLWSAWNFSGKEDGPLAQAFHFSPLSVSLDLSFERGGEERARRTMEQIYADRERTFGPYSHLHLIRNQPEEIEAYARILSSAEVERCPLVEDEDLVAMLLAMGAGDREAMDAVTERWREDVTQEIPFAIASLLLLNCRNGVSREPAEFGKLNRKRMQRGKPPILEHTVIRLRVPRGGMGTGSRSYGRRSAHWVMGHPKVRKTGVFWWSPHVRGEGEAGDGPRTRVVKE